VGYLSGELFALRAGVDVVQVPYRGAAPVVTDLLARRVHLFFANPLAVRGVLESGEVRPLAVTSLQRMRAYPDVPTVAEAGHEGFEAVNWGPRRAGPHAGRGRRAAQRGGPQGAPPTGDGRAPRLG
jgi:tripartite-type tricarboxylate transporter receptor subunit TctC